MAANFWNKVQQGYGQKINQYPASQPLQAATNSVAPKGAQRQVACANGCRATK